MCVSVFSPSFLIIFCLLVEYSLHLIKFLVFLFSRLFLTFFLIKDLIKKEMEKKKEDKGAKKQKIFFLLFLSWGYIVDKANCSLSFYLF